MRIFNQFIVVLAITSAGFANAGTIGVDLVGNSWTNSSGSSWTLGYEFTLDSDQQVDGLGFWDYNGSFNTTTVGLWDSNGSLLGKIDSTSSVDTFAAENGFGYWNFMDFDYSLTAGSYVVGAWGAGMEYAYSFAGDSAINTNNLTFVNGREQSGGVFQYPASQLCGSCKGILGGNISFADSVSVPEPATLALLGLGLAGLGFVRRKKSA